MSAPAPHPLKPPLAEAGAWTNPAPPTVSLAETDTGLSLDPSAPSPPRSDWKKIFDYKSWSKKTQNWVAGIVTGVVGLIILYVVQISHSHSHKPPAKKPPAAAADRDADERARSPSPTKETKP